MSGYTSNGHEATLQAAFDDLCQALTRRWRETVVDAIVDVSYDFPEHFEREVTSHDQQMWPYWQDPNPYHLGMRGELCAYVQWVDGGQKGALSSVSCDGKTTSNGGQAGADGVELPDNIHCGMGSILEQIEGWARAECDIAYERLPKFDTHDLSVLHNAHNEFLRIGAKLGLHPKESSGDLADVSFDAVKGRDLTETVKKLAGEDGEGQDWWAGWTGLAASRAKDGFFASAVPTFENQSCILGALANLYSARASIIEKARNDGLYWVQWATKGLDETQEITTDLTKGWKVVQGVGGAIAISGGWTGIGGAVGATVTLAGFLGENLIPEIKQEDYKHELEDVVKTLFKEIKQLNSKVDELESEYGGGVTDLQTVLYDIHSFDLELYDLTENSAGGDRESDSGYDVNVADILRIGEACFEAGEVYEGLLSMIDSTTEADKHLADKHGSPITADIELLDVRDQLAGFLKTTAGRYLLAGEQVKESAKQYAAVEGDQKDEYERVMGDWEKDGVKTADDYGSNVKPEKWSGDTDRGDFNPNPEEHVCSMRCEKSGCSVGNVSKPGEDAGSDYVTDEST